MVVGKTAKGLINERLGDSRKKMRVKVGKELLKLFHHGNCAGGVTEAVGRYKAGNLCCHGW